MHCIWCYLQDSRGYKTTENRVQGLEKVMEINQSSWKLISWSDKQIGLIH